jgi:hypothetical protein
MENYLWSAFGLAMFAFFFRVYWDVLQAYLAYRNRSPVAGAATDTTPCGRFAAILGWAVGKADRALHSLLMSPTTR